MRCRSSARLGSPMDHCAARHRYSHLAVVRTVHAAKPRVQFHPDGGQCDFARSSARTPHGPTRGCIVIVRVDGLTKSRLVPTRKTLPSLAVIRRGAGSVSRCGSSPSGPGGGSGACCSLHMFNVSRRAAWRQYARKGRLFSLIALVAGAWTRRSARKFGVATIFSGSPRVDQWGFPTFRYGGSY